MAFTMVLFGCNKNEDLKHTTINPELHRPQASEASGNFEPDESEIGEVLSDFNDELADDNVQDRALPEAIWTVEAYLNGIDASDEFQAQDFMPFETSFELDLVSGISEETAIGSSIRDLYDDILDYASNNFPSGHDLYLVDLELKHVASNKATVLTRLWSFKVILPQLPAGTLTYFSSPDSRKSVNDGLCPWSGNPKSMWKAINLKLNPPGNWYVRKACANGSSKWVDLSRVIFDACDVINVDGTLYSYAQLYKLWAGAGPNTCYLAGNATDNGSHQTLNGYLNEALQIWAERAASAPSNRKIKLMQIEGYCLGTYPSCSYQCTHGVEIIFGREICKDATWPN